MARGTRQMAGGRWRVAGDNVVSLPDFTRSEQCSIVT